ncbi:hypothetical protein UFOVP40_23 [uncultured Caudovirales phage]|uniref:Uncharacterized protein n=1 Tax=uncultured Caudovirales phage TaxID=2100421 RepID=A0A6J5KPU5_9CAUD|nr:hypothetical protein UFOVP40_23 [uncultured Caudovirales phage]
MNDSKPWYLSKTLWFNIICAALAALESNTGILQPFLPVNFYSALAVGLPVVNGVLRVITTKGLTA